MSDKDVKRGIAMQAKVDSQKMEKLALGLSNATNLLKGLESGQDQIRETMGIVLNDMSAEEARQLFDLQVTKHATELDITEKRVLCACLYTLMCIKGQNSEEQKQYYERIEQALGVSERKQDFVFDNLNKIDSHKDRLVILRCVCEFLFLNSKNFEYIYDKDIVSVLTGFAPTKDIFGTCAEINSEYTVLGVQGLLNSGMLKELVPVVETQEEHLYLDKFDDESVELTPAVKLEDILREYIADEGSFGKSVDLEESVFHREFGKQFPRLAYDSVIASTKVENGYLLFTGHAMYVRTSKLVSNEYICVPYATIKCDSIATEKGRRNGTRKLTVQFITTDGEERVVSIDDGKILEEKLKDLLIKICTSTCEIKSTDRFVVFSELPLVLKSLFFAALVKLMKDDDANIIGVYMLAMKQGLLQMWDDICDKANKAENIKRITDEVISRLEYPSERLLLNEMYEMAAEVVTFTNRVSGMSATRLTPKTEYGLKLFVAEQKSDEDFNKDIAKASDQLKCSMDDYLFAKATIANDTSCGYELLLVIDSEIAKIHNSAGQKVKDAANVLMKQAGKIGGNMKEALDSIRKK